MDPLPRIGGATRAILTELLRNGDEPQWGLALIRATGRPSGTVYPALERLERAGWVVSSWDDDTARKGPRRRLYRLTGDGASEARRQLAARPARVTSRPAVGALGLRPQPGA